MAAASAMLLAIAGAGPAWSQAAAGGKRWQVELSASSIYDSNVARGSNTVAAARMLRKGEFTYSPNANINIGQRVLGQQLFLTGDVGYTFHQYNKRLRSERIGLQGGLQTGYGPCGLSLVGGLNKGQSDLSQVDLNISRNNQRSTSVAANLSCNPLQGIGVTGGYTYSETRNSSEIRAQDSHQQSGRVGATYSNRLLGTLSINGNYSQTGYNNAQPGDPFTPRGFRQYSGGVSIARPIGTRLTGQAQINYTDQSTDGGGAGFSGLTGSGALTYRVNPRLGLSLSYQRGSQSSIQEGASFVVSQSADIGLNYRLSPRLNLNLGAHGGRQSYRGQTVILPTSLISDDAYGVSSSLSLAVGRNSSIGANAGYDQRSAKPSIYDYSAYRIGVSVSTTF